MNFNEIPMDYNSTILHLDEIKENYERVYDQLLENLRNTNDSHESELIYACLVKIVSKMKNKGYV